MASTDSLLEQAAQALRSAEALVIGAGAGMGVDSGLPDFRGPEGFWKAYPPYQELGLHFVDLANPRWFADDPPLAWGFYGHRRNLYRRTNPHAGFDILRSWAERLPHGAFVFTSNVDGHFQRARFAPECILEVHGSLDWLQCTRECGAGTFPAGLDDIAVDEHTMRAREPLPTCPQCGALARPNILMFGDWCWDPERFRSQETRLRRWLEALRGARLVIVECGAGTAIPTVRHFCERLADSADARLIRLNVREPEVPTPHLGLALGALSALQALAERSKRAP